MIEDPFSVFFIDRYPVITGQNQLSREKNDGFRVLYNIITGVILNTKCCFRGQNLKPWFECGL